MSGYTVDTVFQDFKIQQGTSWTRDVVLMDQFSGQAVSNAGYTAVAMKARTAPIGAGTGAGTVVLTLAVGSGITLGGVTGVTTIALSAAQTLALVPGTYWYDLIETTPAGVTSVLIAGRIIVVATMSQ